MSEKICTCMHGLSEHIDNGKSLVCLHEHRIEAGWSVCPCKAFVWETGDEESDPQSPNYRAVREFPA